MKQARTQTTRIIGFGLVFVFLVESTVEPQRAERDRRDHETINVSPQQARRGVNSKTNSLWPYVPAPQSADKAQDNNWRTRWVLNVGVRPKGQTRDRSHHTRVIETTEN